MNARVEQLWPLFVVRDISASLAFYRDVLGFTLLGTAESNGSTYWCRLQRGGACLMLQQLSSDSEFVPSRDAFYFICDDADLMYAELRGRGLELESPSVAFYGMKQVTVPEPDGREIVFESPTEGWRG